MAQAAAAVIRTGWGTEEDILQQRLWDFPCGSNPQSPRTLAWMPGRVLEDKPEELGKCSLHHCGVLLLQSSGPHAWPITDLADTRPCTAFSTFQAYSGVLPGPVALNPRFKLQDVSANAPVCVIYTPRSCLNVLRMLRAGMT